MPHAQQKTDQRYPYEMLFRSVQYALVDNACREFLFISEFFMLDTNTAQELFNNIFGKNMNFMVHMISFYPGKTLSILVKQTDSSITDSFDSISVFLCIHIVQRYQLLCHKRCVGGLDRYVMK